MYICISLYTRPLQLIAASQAVGAPTIDDGGWFKHPVMIRLHVRKRARTRTRTTYRAARRSDVF